MAVRRRMLDDIAKLSTAAAGLLQGAGREAESLLRERLARLLDRMDLVTREEFDAVKAMAAKAREENEALAALLHRLEAAGAPQSPARPRRSPSPRRRKSVTIP
jgi:BMFP domain-containing protein YqiC